jgi:polysaccharide biosynthesis transport protein
MKSTDSGSIPEIQTDPVVAGKRTEYSNLQRQYIEKSRVYKQDYPEMVRLREQLDGARQAYSTAIGEAHKAAIAAAYADYKEKLSEENALETQMEATRTHSMDMRQKELNYDAIQMEIENKKQLLALLLQKQNQTGVSAQVQEKATPTSRIVELAEMPTEIFEPKIKNNILFALLAGFAGSILLALLLEYFDRTLKTSEDVEHHLHLPFLGVVPYYATTSGNGNSKALAKQDETERAVERYNSYRVSSMDPSSSTSEAVKTLRTSLLLAFPGGPPRSMLVTSSRAGEGKTFTSSNLAVSLTELGKRVVLMDADMRNPQVHRVWNLNNKMGLSIYLASEAPIASILRPSSVERLSLITSGPSTPRPGELLASDRFLDLVKQLERDYDFLVIDSPPVLPVADSVILASCVKGVIMVVRGGATPREIVKTAKKKLSVSSGIIAGVVLNAIDLADPYYYYRYYSQYYASYYGEKPDEKQNGNAPHDIAGNSH